MKKKLFFLVVLLVTMVVGAWGAGFTRTLTGNLEVTGYELKAFYDFQTNTPAVLPTEGNDLRYRGEGGIWGLHNFGTGERTAEVQIPVSEGNLLILQNYTDYTSSIDCGTEDAELSASTGYQVFKIASNANSINITVPRYGGVVAALVMKVTGSEEAELPNLNDYELVKSVTWGDGTSLAGSETCPYKAFETGNKKMQPLTILTSPTDAAGWIAMQGWKGDNSNGWWNRENFGLYSFGGARSAAVFGDDLTTGWLVVFECTQDPSDIMTLTNGDGAPDGTFTYVKDVKNYYCTINAASNAYVGFCGNKSVGYISKISVYKPKASTFTITVADGIENGTVTVDKTEAAEGEEVTVTATPAKGYELDAITVTGNTSNQAVTVTDGKFTMIADAVTVSATFKAHVHDFVEDPSQYSEPSCTEPGKKVSVCICGEKREEEIPALGHDLIEVTTPPTCTEEGSVVQKCNRCTFSNPLNVIPALGHDFNDNGICIRCGYDSNQGSSTEFHYEKATSIAVGDVVLFTNVDAKQELKGIEMVGQNSIGAVQGYEGDTPAAVYPLIVVEGSTADAVSYAFKTADGQYLAWTAGNTLFASDEVNENSSWTVSFTDGVATIVNGADNTRKLQYNATSPRFCAYTSAQKPVTLWKKVAGAAPAPAVAAPVIEGETPFIGSTTVTITCETEGAAIYYTTDGTDPTDESTKYTMAFELTASATVKAIAYDVTGANSDVASKEFVATPTVTTVAELNALADKTEFAFTGEALVVAKPTAKYVYIKDETGSSLVFDKNNVGTDNAVVGKTLAANWTGKVSIFKNLFEAVPDAALSVKDGDPVEVTYPEAQLSDIKAENVNQVVELKGVTYAYTSDNKKLTISIGQENTEAGYNQFGLEIAAAEEGKSYNIVGAIGRYNDNIQFWPISIEEAQTEPAPLYVIGDMNGWSRTAMIEMEFNAETQAYEYSFTNENEFATFAFATYQMTAEEAAEDPQWETFNAEYRWDIGAGDVDATDYVNGDAVQLVKGVDGTVKLPKGTYTVCVDPETMMMTITGTIAPKPTLQYDAVYVAGNTVEGNISWMNGIAWDPLAEANKMTKVEGKDDVWEIVFKDVPAGEDYQFKFIPSGEWSANEETKWSVNFGGDFLGYGIETPAVYNANNNIVFNTTAEKQDITLRIDLSDYDPQTLGGATFTVIAPAEKNTCVIAGSSEELFGTAWSDTSEDNQMELKDGVFTKTYEAVDLPAGNIEYKIVLNGRWIPEDNKICEIPAAGTYGVTVTYNPLNEEITMTTTPIADIVINPEDITGGDITAAIAAKSEGKTVKNLTINLAAGEAYTVSKTITAPNNLVLKGDDKNPATITLAADMTDNVITLDRTKAVAKKSDGTDSDHKLIASVEIIGVKILGLQAALIKDAQKTLLETLTISDAIVEMPAAGKNVIDFNDKGYVGKVVVKNSTIYAKGKNTGFFAQYGSRPKNVNGDWLQEFDVQNSTIVNIANGKNFCDLKQNGTAQNVYTIKNNIFTDCGKSSGQVVVGFNKGQASATPVWDVEANVFNWGGADASAAETTSAGKKSEEDIVKNSHAGVITFADAANGDFNGVFTAEPVKEEPAAEEATSRRADATATLLNCGDPRWTIELKQGQTITIADNIKHGTVKADMTYAGQGTVVTVTATPDENFKLEKITVEGENVDLAIEVTMDPENPNVGTFTMPAGPVIVRAMFKPAKLYAIGINNNWDRTNMTQLEYNAETLAFETSFTAEGGVCLAIATYQMTEEEANADQDWSIFNANYRYAIGDGDVDASSYVNGNAVQLVKGTNNGTVKLPAGNYEISVTNDFMLTIKSVVPAFEYTSVYAVGNGTEGSAWMNGAEWIPDAEANKMTKVDGTDDVWDITFKDVTAGEYKAKFAIDGTWDINFGGSFLGYGFETNAEFNSSDIVFTTTAEKQDITLRIDLSNCAPTTDDPTTYEGATFTVIASVDKNPHVVAGCVGNNGETGAGEADLLFGTTWDGTAEANQLAYDATNGLFTKTYEAVAFEGATDIFYKIVISGWKWVPDGANRTCEIPAAGTYDITVTYNAETGEATMTATLLLPHDIAIAEGIEYGSVATDLTEAKSHTTVTVTVTPDEDYELEKVTVKTDEETPKNVAVTQVDETTYTFEMPDAKVTVSATFIHAPVYKSFAESEVFIPTSEAVADAVAAYWVRHGGNFTNSKKRYITPNLNGDVTEQTSNAPGVGIKKGTAAKTFETYVTNVKTIYAYVSSTSNDETRLFYAVATPTDGSEALVFTKEVDNQTNVVEMTLDATKKWKIEYIGYSTAKDESGEYKLKDGKDLVLHGLKIISASTVGVNGVNADKYADGAWYTTGGVRVDKPTKKGLYIHNGRTVVVK